MSTAKISNQYLHSIVHFCPPMCWKELGLVVGPFHYWSEDFVFQHILSHSFDSFTNIDPVILRHSAASQRSFSKVTYSGTSSLFGRVLLALIGNRCKCVQTLESIQPFHQNILTLFGLPDLLREGLSIGMLLAIYGVVYLIVCWKQLWFTESLILLFQKCRMCN